MSDFRRRKLAYYVFKTPVVDFHPEKGLRIRNDAVKARYNVQVPEVAKKPKGKWINVKMSQILMKRKLMFRVVIDGVEKALMEVKDPSFYKNAKVYTTYTFKGQPPVLDGWMRGLQIKFKENEQFVPNENATPMSNLWYPSPAILT